MSFESSLGGIVASRLWPSPARSVILALGGGAAVFGGVRGYAGTAGSSQERLDAGANYAVGYGLAGAGVTGVATAGIHSYLDRYGTSEELYRGLGHEAGRSIRNLPNYGRRFSEAARDYTKGLINEFRSPGGWKTALSRPAVSGGIGALVGGAIGNKLGDGDNRAIATGAAAGTVVGMAAGRAAHASRVWAKWGSGTRTGVILAASALVGGGLRLMQGNQPAQTDTASTEDYAYMTPGSGVRDRMNRIGAGGDLVFGLHNSR